MAWVQITGRDTDGLKTVQEILLGMHSYYKLYTPEWLSNELTIHRHMQPKIFLYQDGVYDICGITRMDNDGRMQMFTGGVRTESTDIQTAADILNKKFITEMGVYGAKYAHGVYGKDNTPLAADFYSRMKSVGQSSGFHDARDYDLSQDSKALEFYTAPKDENTISIIDEAIRVKALEAAASATPAEDVKK